MQVRLRLISVIVTLFSVAGCSVVNTHPVSTIGRADLTPTTNLSYDLRSLPLPKGPMYVAVYGFKDQSGQYKASPDSNFSTAVTQGGSSLLVKALKDSRWFIPVERENLQDVLTERKIVKSVETPSDGENRQIKLPTLTGARLLIEGAIVGYDSNIKTGGLGVKYLGISGSNQYRADQVTIHLRAIDTYTGQVLHSVSTTKTVYSIELNTGVYKFVRYKSLLEAEVGMTMNEPAQLAVQEAIEAGVISLISEGIEAQTWFLANQDDYNNSPVLKRYRQDQQLPMVAVTTDKNKKKVAEKNAVITKDNKPVVAVPVVNNTVPTPVAKPLMVMMPSKVQPATNTTPLADADVAFEAKTKALDTLVKAPEISNVMNKKKKMVNETIKPTPAFGFDE